VVCVVVLASVQGHIHGVVVVPWSVANHLPNSDVGGGGERFLSQVCRCAAGKACRAKVFADTLVSGDGSSVLGRRFPVEGAIAGCFVLQHGISG
jgi:hypothetical protein